jgi:hypothetical protein
MTSNSIRSAFTQNGQGIFLDPLLAEELSNPGSDLRGGVNIIVHPAQEIQDQIARIQQYLKRLDPKQYYYPIGDLHLTLLEICSSRPRAEVDEIASIVRQHILSIVQGIPPFQISSPALVCDQKACALSFEDHAPFLLQARQQLIDRISGLGVDYLPRYFPKTAHITIMRYINPLNPDLEAWSRHLELTPIDTNLTWNIKAVTLSWGATWYGMQSRIDEAGPYDLI